MAKYVAEMLGCLASNLADKITFKIKTISFFINQYNFSFNIINIIFKFIHAQKSALILAAQTKIH